jgi:hypothetical protein
MHGEELINVAQAATHGDSRYVRNVRTRKEGVVVAMNQDIIEVHVKGSQETWKAEECEEIPVPLGGRA